MGSQEARVAVELVEDMMWTRCCENLCDVAMDIEVRNYGCRRVSGLHGDISTHPGLHECSHSYLRALALPASPTV
jgi:hypothetical protein